MWSADIVAALSTLAMAVVWVVYLELFWGDLRKRTRPSLIIHHATGKSPHALCLFVNMSREPVHVQCVFARLTGRQGSETHYLTDYARFDSHDEAAHRRLREGPIQPGGYLVLGTFEDIILGRDVGLEEEAGHGAGSRRSALEAERLRSMETLEICVAVTHGQIDDPIGARRAFLVEQREGESVIRAYSIQTEQLVKRRGRRVVRQWVENRLEPKVRDGRQEEDAARGEGG